ncbi:MAG TPA: SOS response-associated peptidase [Candidatus Lachnoclostridium stercorigallinarum]|uniref:Abasic site processing protein n=1 Tax=Candidatus Lachnoclostridium stercorigallinarum TaxID=2838634 RepID=A0A9D2K5U9_9FIRM|nr:SOS response-associated peptidase [Candidatus Lachnoclostridium stercorigallinarum]
MCCRYYVDDSVDALLKELDLGYAPMHRGREDRFPSCFALTVCARDGHTAVEKMKWGFPQGMSGGNGHGSENRSGLVINARAETVLERPLFRDGARSRRCLIPAAGFYEWNREKEKAAFYRPDRTPLLMAGICLPDPEGDGDRFVIITTGANRSVFPVHERMPLILERGQWKNWLFDGASVENLLAFQPEPLERFQEYEQQTLVF